MASSGVLSFQQVYRAADGLVGRLHFPGGRISSAQWEQLASLAEDTSDGSIYLTARGNIHLRGLRERPECVPGPVVVAAPGHARLAALSAELAGAVRQELLIGLDAGNGAILRLRPDISLVLIDDTRLQVVGKNLSTGPIVTDSEAVAMIVSVLSDSALVAGETWDFEPTKEHPAPIGWLENADDPEVVSLGAGVPLGRMDARLAQFLAAIEVDIFVTPWHSLYIPDLPAGVAEQVVKILAPMGLIFDAQSPWLQVSACIGQPGCAHALADVRGDLISAVSSGQLEVDKPVFFSGCAKRCGHPRRAHVEYQASGAGDYEVFERF
ncbi:hypothetical protein SFC07_08465 [Corynebacterium callunae]|uniref:hypothetical protein n=1 Tax=Corynebacterium callunae TaxID=1721 RepID=UPI0039822C70